MPCQRRNITQPTDLWEAIETAASREGKTVSQWIGEAAIDRLPDSVSDALSERRTRGRPKREDGDE